MTNGKDEYVHFDEVGKLTPLGEEAIEKRQRQIVLDEIRNTLVSSTKGILEAINKRKKDSGNKFTVEIPNEYIRYGVNENIDFLRDVSEKIGVILEQMGSVDADFFIENIPDLFRFVDYVDTLIYVELSKLKEGDPYPSYGQKYLNSPPPKRSKDYSWDDGYPPDYPDDENEEGKNGS